MTFVVGQKPIPVSIRSLIPACAVRESGVAELCQKFGPSHLQMQIPGLPTEGLATCRQPASGRSN